MPLLYPTSCKCSTESFVNSASPFPLLFFLDFLFFLESKGSKRKSIAGKLFFCAFGGLANVQRKTDGAHTSRPFFRCKLDVRENAFCRKCPPLSRYVFCFFSSRKEIVPLLFFLEEKKQKKIICGTGSPAAPAAFAGLQHKNGQLACERPFFRFQQDVRENAFCRKCPPQPLCLLFLFFKKRNRSPSFLFRRKEIVP